MNPASNGPSAPMIKIYSQLSGPIEDIGQARRSLLFAEISNLTYFPEPVCRELAGRLGLSESRFFDRGGAQAYVFETRDDCIVACRGTEPNDWNDIKADVNAARVAAETVGRVHRGFKEEVDDLWPLLEKVLMNNTKTLWFCGHSLGGAMASICAGRCRLSHIRSNPHGLYTYGCPRVGTSRYVHYVELNYTRWVNNNDIVTRVPPAWTGYRHAGREMYLNAYGKVRKVSGWQRTKDRWRGFWMGVKKGHIDNFEDHSIDHYIEFINNYVEEQKSAANNNGSCSL
ncbi:MAG: lipase family protein [Thermodesulfobacteriota bacterium]